MNGKERRINRRAVIAAAGALAVSAFLSRSIDAAEPASLEYAVKATFIYKFTPFVEWPPTAFGSPESPLIVCVAGNDPVSQLIDEAANGQRDGGRPIAVRHLTMVARDSQCHVLYATGTPAQSAADAFAAVRGNPVLTVTDSASGPARAMITFVVENNRVRFDIDDRAAAEAGLVISSKLLSLARSVVGRG
jgi:hypothetical protein